MAKFRSTRKRERARERREREERERRGERERERERGREGEGEEREGIRTHHLDVGGSFSAVTISIYVSICLSAYLPM